MDLPEEDKTALAKRRAIQALMKNTSLSPAQRHKEMQEIMKGNFTVDDDDDDVNANANANANDNDDYSEYSGSESEGSYSEGSEEGSYYSGSEEEYSSGTRSRQGSSDYESGSYESDSMDGTQSEGGESIDIMSHVSEGSSQHSASQYSRESTQYSREGSSHANHSSYRSRNSESRSQRGDDFNDSHRSGNSKMNDSSRSTNSKSNRRAPVDRQQSDVSNASASPTNSAPAQNKEKQKALLEISRDKTLSAKERQIKMKEIMQTPVQGITRRSVDGSENNSGQKLTRQGSTRSTSDKRSLPRTNSKRNNLTKGESWRHRRRTSRKDRENKNKDSIRECVVPDEQGIQPLRMSRRHITGNVTKIKNLLERITRNDPTLVRIELQKANLSDEDVIPLLDALGNNEHVVSLDLRRNRIGIEGCSTLASAILDNRTLASIDVSGNNLGDGGLEDLSKVIPYNKTLTTLNIEDNKIGDMGAAAFAESLAENTTLKQINLSGNLIGDAGASDLFKVLSSANSTVTSLLLRFNAISDKGATELASALLDNEALNVVDLGHNKITNVGAKDLLKVVSINETLEELVLRGNVHIDEDMLDEIQRVLEEEEDSEYDDETESGSEEGSEEGSESSYSEEMSESAESRAMENSADSDKDEANAAPTGGEAMLEDMPDENNTALAKRKLIQQIMQDKSLSGIEKNKKIQDVMAGRVELPKVEPKKPTPKPRAAKPADSRSTPRVDSAATQEEESESEEESEYSQSTHGDDPPQDSAAVSPSSADGDAQLTGGEAMLTDMPDEDNAALAKRKAIQSVMQDRSLNGQERNKKIQDIMAGRVELPKFVPLKPPAKSQTKHARRPAARSRSQKEEESKEESESSQSIRSEGKPSNSAGGRAAASSGSEAQLTGGEAMLEDMPDENNTALAKRKAIQSVMQDRSLSGVERNKKIQDIMAGKVELPRVESKKQSRPPAAAETQANQAQSPAVNRQRSQEESSESSSGSDDESEGSSYYSEGSDSEHSSQQDRRGSPSSLVENKDTTITVSVEGANSNTAGELTGGEAMLTDMPDESDNTLAKRRAIQEVKKDKSLSGPERMKKIQDIMAGRAKLPPPPAPPSSPPKKPKAVKKSAAVPVSNAAAPSRRGGTRKAATTKKQVEVPKKGNDATKSKQLDPRRQPKPKGVVAKVDNKKPKQKQRKLSREGSNNSLSSRALLSNDGGTRAAIAHEWKRRMRAVHPRSHDNLLDILLAHQYRLSLKFPPNQSFFRVVAVVFFSRVVDGVTRSERYHVVGTNDEPHSIAGSICAERAALMQLRFIPDLDSITKVVIVSDAADAITPGMLCREFMASHNRIPWDVPIVLGRSVCRKCGFTVSGKAFGDVNGCFDEAENAALQDATANVFGTCTKGHDGAKSKEYPTPHDFVGTITTLRDLFPHPSPYVRMTSAEAQKFGESYFGNNAAMLSKHGEGKEKKTTLAANGDMRYSEDQSIVSFRQERFDLTMLTDIMEEDEDGGGQVNTVNGDEKSESTKGTNTQSSRRQVSAASPVKSSMSQSLKTTIDFMKILREDQPHGLHGQIGHNSTSSNLSNSSDALSLEHLKARTIRVSSRLKPSQRREKLLRLATEVTALEIHTNKGIAANAHPIRYGAAVLFSDGTVTIAAQKVAIEYGCTLDAVGQLASAIDKKALRLEEDVTPCRPILLVQCDQYGIAHAPFAPGRAFLTERGYGDCKVLVHQQRQPGIQGGGTTNGGEYPQAQGGSQVEERSSNNSNDNIDLRLLEVEANDLAPAPPDIFGGMITKNHSSQGGLEIQF